jgi:hypothetical protein
MAERTCWNCVYVSCEPGRWLRRLAAGEPLVPRCANHLRWPGWLREVPGVPCRNYQARPAEPPDDIRRIPLGRGKYAYVDAADYEWLSQWKWRLRNGYAMRFEKGGKVVLMHREIMQPPRGKIVDHWDGNRCNNYRANLRTCTRGENSCNAAKQAGASSRFKGVSWHRHIGKWYASIGFQRQSTFLGYFDDEVEAARVYDRAAVERFGVFARPNFPEDWPVERREEVHAQWLKANGRRKDARPKAKRADRPGGKGHGAAGGRATRRKARAAASKAPARRGRKHATTAGSARRR